MKGKAASTLDKPNQCFTFTNAEVADEVKIRLPSADTCKRTISISKYGCKDQEWIQSSTTPDPGYQWESDKLTVDTTNESQEVSPFPAGDHKAHINRRAQRHCKHKQNKNIKDPQKKYRLGTVSKIFYWRA